MAIDTLGANALASNSVTSAKIADGAVVAADVADGSVTTAKLAADAVTAAKLADNAVVSANLSAGTIEGSGVNLGRRNLLINGAMQVQQRGDQTGLTDAYTGVDRFKFLSNGGSVVTGKQGGAGVSTIANGFPKSLHIQVTTADTSLAAGDYALVRQLIEGRNIQHLKYGTSSAETVTLSFWVKSPKTGVHWVEMFTFDSSKFNSASYTVNSANTWEKKTVSFVGETTAAIADDNTTGILVQWWLVAGSTYSGGTHPGNVWHTTHANRVPGQVNVMDSTSNNFYLTGTQLEIGSSATNFEHLQFTEDLQNCMRYYYQSNYGAQFTTGDLYFGRNGYVMYISFPTNMRANPSVTTCTDVSLPSGGGSGHYVVHGTGNYTDGANLHSTPNQFTMYTPQRSSSQPTKTGFKANAEL